MKAFEKIWGEEEIAINKYLDEIYGKESTAQERMLRHNILIKSKAAAMKYWKAALEWVKIEALPDECLDYYSGNITRKIIDRELNEREDD